MGNLGRWEIILLIVAAYVAVMTLVRLMARRRDQLISEVEQQVKARKRRKR